jgi:nucleoid-associated protein YgaU
MSPEKMEGGLTPGTEEEKETAVDLGMSDSLHRPKSGIASGRKEKLGSAQKTYTVQSGDTLQKIAQAVYGDASRWKEIFEANRDQISNPNVIRVGQELTIP